MTQHALNLTRAEAGEVVDAIDLLDGYPSAGVHVGGGLHVSIQPAWDGTGPVPVGWTKHAIRQRPGNGVYGVSLPEYTVARRSDPVRRARLSATQRVLIDALVLVPTLPPEWGDPGV